MMLRRTLIFFIVIALGTLAAAQGPITQTTRSRKQQGPRAIAVIRWQADEKGSGHPVLLPVAIVDEGKVFDASVYKTSPQPMALEPGTVYEAQRHGVPMGLFTITAATHSNAEDHPWLALGKWKLDIFSPKDDPTKRQANVIIGTPKAEKDLPPVEPGETQRRTTQVYDESGRPVDNPTDDEPPALGKNKKPERIDRQPQVSPPEPKSKPTTTTTDDSDRPRLHKGPPQQKPTQTAANTPAPAKIAPADDDPNRPRLKRGKPTGEIGDKGPADAPIAPEIISRASVNRPRTYELAAVSDADTSRIVQDYTLSTTLSERQSFLRKMEQLVDNEFRAKTPPEARSGLRRSKGLDPSRFADIRFELLDVDSNNSPELVLTGAYVLSPTQRIPFALVARGDYEGNPHTLLFEKNERFEFIDAVDLDGDGPGELLFRRIAASGPVFVIYRLSADGASEVFRGGTAE